jgi:hypothetical protein
MVISHLSWIEGLSKHLAALTVELYQPVLQGLLEHVIYVYRCLNMGNRDIKFKSKANQELMVCF